jgi:anti-sigma regulatory factor (Ser/Thr protein kinase)
MTTILDELRLTMRAIPESARIVRARIRRRLRDWGYSHIADDAQLIATELITNAANATPGEEIGFRLCRVADDVVLAVWDSGEEVPVARPQGVPTLDDLDLDLDLDLDHGHGRAADRLDDNGGRGLRIVAALAAEFGYERVPAGGKWVWARMTPRPGPG